MSSSSNHFNLLSFKDNIRILHLTWFAFFLSFMVWFNHAPLLSVIQEALNLTTAQIKTLLILNVALTIPARIIVGMLVDKYGPKIMYSFLLCSAGILSLFFALADTFQQLALARFLLGFIGAGFVIGIRMIGEWFPAKRVGVAEGIYGGWGNFGSAASAMILPGLALYFGGEDGWRYAIASIGIIAFVYGIIYYLTVTDTPKGSTYFKPKKMGAMEVTSVKDFYLYLLMNLPMYLALAVLTWKLSPSGVSLITANMSILFYLLLGIIYCYQTYQVYRINKHIFTEPVPEIHRYKFKQVAILDICYMVTFGSELAVVSMLPLFFQNTFDLSIVHAGLLASGFAFMNLVARPGGGLISDHFGRKRSLTIFLLGLMLGYFLMSMIDSSWSIVIAVMITMLCSFFVQAGEGAVFAIVPLVQRRMTGQIAGMAGAYGNIGAVSFLTVFAMVSSTSTFFLTIAGAAVIALIAVQFMDEPQGQTAEVMPDGSIQMIDVG